MISPIQSLINTPEKFSVQEIQNGIQDGVIPAYIGMPILQQKVQQQKQAMAMMAPQGQGQGQPQTTVADDINNSVASLHSNLPVMHAASGGVMALAEGGDFEDENDDDNLGFDDNLVSGSKEDQALFNRLQDQINTPARLPETTPMDDFVDSYTNEAPMAAPTSSQAPSAGIMAAPGAQMMAEKIGQTQAYQGPGMNKPVVAHKEETRVKEPAKETDMEKARHYNVGNLRPDNFTYKGQIGKSKSGFALFDSPESGINALTHDIQVKLNRGVNTPEQFINIYAPRKSKGGDNPDSLTDAYINNVSKALDIRPGDKIPNTPAGIAALRDAIIRQEGAQYTHLAQGGVVSLATGGVIGFAGGGLKSNPTENSEGDMDPVTGMPNFMLNVNPVTKFSRQNLERAEKMQNNRSPIGYTPSNKETTAQYTPGVDKGATVPKLSQSALERYSNPAVQDLLVSRGLGNTASSTVPNPFAPSQSQVTDDAMYTNIQNPQPATGAAPQAESQQAAPQDDYLKTMVDILNKRQNAADQQRNIDKYMGLLTAGLGIMSKAGTVAPGVVHSAFGDIGGGAQAGIASLANARRNQIAEENSIMSGQLGLARANLYEKSRADALTQRKIENALHVDYLNRDLDIKNRNAQTMQEKAEAQNRHLQNLVDQQQITNQFKRADLARKYEDQWIGSPEEKRLLTQFNQKNWASDPKKLGLYNATKKQFLNDRVMGEMANQDIPTANSLLTQ